MSRFRKDPDPRFWRLNRSIEFDWRLAPYDIDQSQAHARGLREIGVLDDEELRRDRRRPRAGPLPDGRARLRVRRRRRGHPHGDRAAARRGDRPARRQAAHRPLPQRPGRHRRGDGRPVALAAGDRAGRGGDGAPARPRRAPPRLADARLHPPAARPARLPRPPPARLLLDARPRRPALPVRARQRQRDAARLRRPGRRQLGDRPPRRRRRPRLRARQPELDRRRLEPRLRPRLPRRRVGLRDAPLPARLRDRALVEQRVRLLRARRVLLLGLEHHAPEEEPRLRRAAARQEPPGRRGLRVGRRDDARAAAHLRQGHAGGQGAAVRRDRHDRALPRRRPRGC